MNPAEILLQCEQIIHNLSVFAFNLSVVPNANVQEMQMQLWEKHVKTPKYKNTNQGGHTP